MGSSSINIPFSFSCTDDRGLFKAIFSIFCSLIAITVSFFSYYRPISFFLWFFETVTSFYSTISSLLSVTILVIIRNFYIFIYKYIKIPIFRYYTPVWYRFFHYLFIFSPFHKNLLIFWLVILLFIFLLLSILEYYYFFPFLYL